MLGTETQIDPKLWDAFIASEAGRNLTPQRLIFVFEYLVHGDRIKAARVAYPTALEKSVHAIAWELMQSPVIKQALDFWKDDRTRLIEIVEAQLAAAVPGSVAAARFTAQLERLRLGAPATETAKPDEPEAVPAGPEIVPGIRGVKVGAIVLVDGVKYRVTVVDAEGRPLEGEPIE